MAAEDEGRTEEPSEHRLEQARKEGRVAKSQEISSALILLLTITVLLFMGRWMMSQCLYILQYFFSRTNNPDVRDANLFSAFLINFLKMLAPVAGVAVFAGITANVIQNKACCVRSYVSSKTTAMRRSPCRTGMRSATTVIPIIPTPAVRKGRSAAVR